jgi:hypothetical protein
MAAPAALAAAAAAVAAPAPACLPYLNPSQLSGTWCVYWNNRIGDGMKFGFDFTLQVSEVGVLTGEDIANSGPIWW